MPRFYSSCQAGQGTLLLALLSVPVFCPSLVSHQVTLGIPTMASSYSLLIVNLPKRWLPTTHTLVLLNQHCKGPGELMWPLSSYHQFLICGFTRSLLLSDAGSVLATATNWDELEIQEETESGSSVTSKIRLPTQVSHHTVKREQMLWGSRLVWKAICICAVGGAAEWSSGRCLTGERSRYMSSVRDACGLPDALSSVLFSSFSRPGMYSPSCLAYARKLIGLEGMLCQRSPYRRC